MPIHLVLVDDHPIVLDGLVHLFSRESDLVVLAACSDGQAALAAVEQHRPDVLVLDLSMPKMDGLAVLRELHAKACPTKVVILTAALGEDEVLEAIRLGARGVVLKEMASQLLVQCVRRVAAGGEWLERQSVSRALDKILRQKAAQPQADSPLTSRELEIVRKVVKGLRNKEIAKALSISEATVKTHLHRIYEKLEVDSRTQLALIAQQKGLL